MDSLIQGEHFLHDDKQITEEFENRVKEWRKNNEKTMATAQIVSAFQTLGKKLTESKCPTFKTEGWKQAVNTFRTLQELAGVQIVNGTTHPGDFHEVLYKIIIDWFHFGPATVHLLCINTLLRFTDLGMKEYTTTLKDEALNKLVRAVTSPVEKKEDTPSKDFYQTYRWYLGEFFELAFEQNQLSMEDTMKTLVDFVFHLYLDYAHLDDDAVNAMARQAKTILSMYSQWKNFSDAPRLKSYLKRFGELAKTPGFPRNKVIADMVYTSLSTITKQLQTLGQVETFSDDIFDLLQVLSQGQGELEHVTRAFDAGVLFFDQRKTNKNKPSVFKAVAPRFMSLVALLDDTFLKDTRFVSDVMTMLENSYADNSDLHAQWLALCIPLMRRQTLKTVHAARNVLSKHDKIKWKEHEDFVVELLDALKEILQSARTEGSQKSCYKELTNCISYLLRGLKRARIVKNFAERLMYLSIQLVEMKEDELFEAAEDVGEHIEINVKENKEAVMGVMRRVHAVLRDDSYPWDDKWTLQRAVGDIIESIMKAVKDGKIFSDEDFQTLTSMCVTCVEKEVINPDTGVMSAHFLISMKIMNNVLQWLGAVKKLDMAVELIPLLIAKLEEDDNNVVLLVGKYLGDFSTLDPTTLVPYFDELLKIFVEKELASVLGPIYSVYSDLDVTLKDHFQELFTLMLETNDAMAKATLPTIFWTAGKKEADLFTEANLNDLIERAKSDANYQGMYLQTLQDISKRKPGRLVPHLNILMDKKGWNPMLMALINDILSTVALYDKSISLTVLEYFITSVQTNPDKGVLITALNAIRLIGFKYSDVIKPKRSDIEALQIIDADGQGQRQTILDIIDGKTSEDVKRQLEAQQDAVISLVEKVDDVEGTVAIVAGELEEQKLELDDVKSDVTEQTKRLDQVKETVEDTAKKVEDIDSKTLSHAPYWSRDISKLLNPETDHDWRLLSSRLGYSNADIRGWAQQADPCMAVLNEWYATRKTSEATYAILTNLQEMDRTDAALIVENAMKKAEAVVEDEEFEYTNPPEIFLSYQWGHQEEVKLLQRHLAMAGFDCWLDIGQMGGGDKLFEKIDNGMRAAKLVISCVTSKYAKSPNCNREVTLAVGVNKPIIPLLLESCPWPPAGSMGPIFSESLYIQFYKTGEEEGEEEEETKDNRYWPVKKFQELLMQISAHGLTPDQGKVDAVYRNWWMPLEEEIYNDKSKARDGGTKVEIVPAEENVQSVENPDVFISYQWDKQKNIINLYKRLTSLGLSCWLDIKQMGGGDSLYDKIDRGIRGCKVVVSCVTKKYAMSANCRREVSLADALKKPMLPLLLEEMGWPPAGPMGVIMTQCLYLRFQQDSQLDWEGPTFQELVDKIKSHLNKDNINGVKASSTLEPPGQACNGAEKKQESKSETTEHGIPEMESVSNNDTPSPSKRDDEAELKPSNQPEEMRPKSAVSQLASPKPEAQAFGERLLPPPGLRLQTSRSCSVL